MEKQSPFLRLWELGESEHGGLIRSMIAAAIGVLGGMLPYYAAAQVIITLLGGNRELPFYLGWCAAGLIGYALRACLYALALSMSHKATFTILKNIRGRILDKLPKLPLGTIVDTSSGKMKQIIVDQVESMETPLAHLLPEMTGNLFGPVCILIFLFVLDWRMALLSLASIPVGMLFMMLVMIGYGEKYAGSVRTAQEMNAAIVEYAGGIEVIKAFNQGKNSYAKYSKTIIANAAYFYNWMKSCQFPTSLAKAIMPTTLITVLPVGWLLYSGGSLSVETFITTLILSLGIAGPLLAAMNFMDSLAKVGTIVGTMDEILTAEEQRHSQQPVKLGGMDLALENVCFGYRVDLEILHDISLKIPAGTMTAFVGTSGSGMAILRMADSAIHHAEQIDRIPQMDEGGSSIQPKRHDITFENVRFSYGQKEILHGVSLTIPDRTTTAVIGPSGSGKTTLCNLIARFWDVDGGAVKIGGHDVREYTLESLMDQISMVFQNVYLFVDTIENNIKFGRPDATHAEVVEAARRACCDDFIEALPEGYNTVIGEGGASLSGGEKQRISIARAMLKDAPIVILDEATANVDPENEEKI